MVDPDLILRFEAKDLARVLRAHARALEAEATRLEGEVASARGFSLATLQDIPDTDMVRIATEIVRRLRDGELRGIMAGEARLRQLRAEASRVRLAAKHLVPGMTYDVRYRDLPFNG
jgi:hypothetical protein